jgi:hypothetical protein
LVAGAGKHVGKQPVETTLYSLGEQPPAPDERRTGQRHMTLFRVGTLLVDGRRELCLIRNISGGGMLLRAYCPLESGRPVAVELKNGQPIPARVSWIRDEQAGITFDQPIDVLALLASDDEGPRPRMPRIEMDAAVFVREGAATWRLTCCDVSQGGLKLTDNGLLTEDADVVVTLAGLSPRPGVVRWSAGGQAGIAFNSPLPLSELVAWLQSQRASRAA